MNITTGLGWAMGFCVGNTGPVDRLGFPSICLQDGPLGLRFTDKSTAFPAGITAGSEYHLNRFCETFYAEHRVTFANIQFSQNEK